MEWYNQLFIAIIIAMAIIVFLNSIKRNDDDYLKNK